MSQTGQVMGSDAGTLGRACAFALLWWTLMGIVVAGGAMSAVLMPLNDVEYWHGFVAATVITFPSALSGMFPVVLVAARGLTGKIPMAFLVGTSLRLMTAFALLLVGNMIYSVPQKPTAVFILAFYGVILGTEVFVLVSYLRRMFPSVSAGPASVNAGPTTA